MRKFQPLALFAAKAAPICLGLLAFALTEIALLRQPAAQMAHRHGVNSVCKEPELACASKATPTFGPDGALWLAWDAGGRVAVARSVDLGRTFTPAVPVNNEPAELDWGPDARPQIVVDKQGRVFVAYAVFRDKAFNGEVFLTRSTDGGRSFEPPRPVTADRESQRFQALALDPAGSLFLAWLDKRNRRVTGPQGQKYVGAALAFAWSDDGTKISDTRIAHDNTCECCRLAVAFAGPGKPVILFRNIFDRKVRDHAVMTFINPSAPGPIHRVSIDDWEIDACPHHGPSLSIAGDGTYHAAWFTNGRVRRGLFYARSTDGGRSFSQPMPIGRADRNPAHPFVLAVPGAIWLAWTEFDGTQTDINVMGSHDGGKTWSAPKSMARTADTSDAPLLVANGNRVFLSWMTQSEGYRLIDLEGGS